MKITINQFYGLRRSGNHAILEWLLFNFNQSNREIESTRVVRRGDSLYFNEMNSYSRINETKIIFKYLNLGVKNFIFSYEEQDTFDHDIAHPFSKNMVENKIIISRNLRSNAASRLKRGTPDMRVDNVFFNRWLNHRKHCSLTYEDWLTNKKSRDDLCQSLRIENFDKRDVVSHIGNGSSFIGQSLDSVENLINRGKNFNFNKLILEKIEKIEKSLDNPKD